MMETLGQRMRTGDRGGDVVNEAKIAPQLMARLQVADAQLAEVAPAIPAIVRYRQDAVRTHTVRPGLRARYVYRLTPTLAVSASRAEIGALSDDDEIEYIWLDEEVHTCLDRAVGQIGLPPLWASGLNGGGIKVAVVDTGLDATHPDLLHRVAARASFVGGDGSDDNGHGTHVGGIIAGDGSASGGTYRGIASGATLYGAKVLDQHGSGSMSTVMAGVEWAVSQNVHVINLSLGGSGSSDGQDALSLTCNAAVARGIVVCAAAGNFGPAPRTVGAPGAAVDVITVGAVDRTDGIARFSSRGPTADGRTKPDVCLPGTDIVAARAAGTQLGTLVGERYVAASGTSMATPQASGLTALLLQAAPGLQPADVKRVLTESALDLGVDANAQGAGRVRALEAWQQVKGTPPGPTPTPGPGGGTEPPTGERGCLPTFLVPFLGR
jgi:serine protease AprX